MARVAFGRGLAAYIVVAVTKKRFRERLGYWSRPDCKSVYSGSIPPSGLQRADAVPLLWVPALIPGSSVVEQAAVNRWVDGSNPSRGANHDGGQEDIPDPRSFSATGASATG